MATNAGPFTITTSTPDRIRVWLKHAWETIRPGPLAWKGAALGLLVVAVFSILIASYTAFLSPPRIVRFLMGSAQFIVIAAIVGALLVLLLALLGRIPTFYGWGLVVTLVLLFVSFFISILGFVSPTGMLIFMLDVIVVASLLGAAVWVLARGGWRTATGVQRVITLLGLVLGLAGLAAGANWLLGAGQAVEPPPNAATTTIPGGMQSGENLTVWREQAVELIASIVYGPIDTSAVYLGWNAGASENATYTIRLPDKGLELDANSTLVFSLADANEDPTPRTDHADDAASQSESGPREPIDLTIEVVDDSGHAVPLPLSHFSYLQPQIVQTIMKAPFMNIAGPSPSESVFQSFEFPLAAFVEAKPELDPASLTMVSFIFDRTPAGVIVLDDLGFRN